MNHITNNLPENEYKSRDIIKSDKEKRKCKKCNCILPPFIMENGKQIDCRNRVYCLSCSPVGSRKMCGRPPKFWERGSTNGLRDITILDKICKTCGKVFHQAGRNLECTTCRNKINRDKNKTLALQYKGGKCSLCGYNKCIKALEFHHLDPTKKEISLSASWGNNFEKIKLELDKCVLLCANCHREVHNN